MAIATPLASSFGMEGPVWQSFVPPFLCNSYITVTVQHSDTQRRKRTNVMAIDRHLDILCEQGHVKEALWIMQQEGIALSRNNAYILSRSITKNNDLQSGRRLQMLMVLNGLDSIAVLAVHLIRLFASQGCLAEANYTFNNILEPTSHAWVAIVIAHATLGPADTAFELYLRMQSVNVRCNKNVKLSMLKSTKRNLLKGRFVHENIIQDGLQSDAFLASILIDMYAKCGCLFQARMIFDQLTTRDVVSWSVMIAGYVKAGEGFLALECFESMQMEDIKPDKVTFLSIIKACGSLASIEIGRGIHEQVIQSGFQFDSLIRTTLMDMYSKCESLEEAWKIFQTLQNEDAVAWNVMISAFAHNNKGMLVLEHFNIMRDKGMLPDNVTFLSIVKACGSIGVVELGRHIHAQIIYNGFQDQCFIGNALVDMYAKCGSLEEALAVFDNLTTQDVVSWNSIISACVQHDEWLLALECYSSMQHNGLKPDKVTLLSMLKVCGSTGAIEQGKHIHNQIVKNEIHYDACVGNALVDMYAKCGNMEDACKVFEGLQNKNVVSWSAMIAGYAQLENAAWAVYFFEAMQVNRIKPNDVTFLAVLTACSRAGLVDIGLEYFNSMKDFHDIAPNASHYGCVVDILGRAGSFLEAQILLNGTSKPSIISWMSLLSACRMHGNVEMLISVISTQ